MYQYHFPYKYAALKPPLSSLFSNSTLFNILSAICSLPEPLVQPDCGVPLPHHWCHLHCCRNTDYEDQRDCDKVINNS